MTQKLKKEDLVINDSGAETTMGYAGDITRTIPVGGRFPCIEEIEFRISNNYR